MYFLGFLEAFLHTPHLRQLFLTLTGAWGLDRIDQRDAALNGIYSYGTTASDVHVYILDTGIRLTHSDFGGRAVAGYDAVGDANYNVEFCTDDPYLPPPDGFSPKPFSVDDTNGHGTAVAGVVGGNLFGVAKGVALYAVRVFNRCASSSDSTIINGIDWVISNHQSPAVINGSFGESHSTPVDGAVQNAIQAGITFVVSAGNKTANACNYSPADVAEAITVGATGYDPNNSGEPSDYDQRAPYSNYGSCLDLFAPGTDIETDGTLNDTATVTLSGTSLAAPYVTGVAALYLAFHPSATPAQVSSALVNMSTPGIVTDAGSGSPNLLLYSSPTSTASGTPPSISTTNGLSNPVYSGNTYTISWGASSGVVGWYQLQQSVDDSTFSSPTAFNMHTLRSTTFTARTADYTFMYYRVRACNIVGCSSWRNGATTEIKASSGGGGGGCSTCQPQAVPEPASITPASGDGSGASA